MNPSRLLQTRAADDGLALDFRGDEGEHRVRLGDPAEMVMTDFRHLSPISIGLNASLELAVNRMVLLGVRFLFVVDPDERLAGSINWAQLHAAQADRRQPAFVGEFPPSRSRARVWHVMEPKAAWRVLRYEDVRRARVAELVIAFKVESRRHLVVVQERPGGSTAVRGLFSLARVERQLGVPIELNGHARLGAACSPLPPP